MGEFIDRAKGKAKQIQGDLTDDDDKRTEGAIDEIKGNVKGVARKSKNAGKNIAGAVRDALKSNSNSRP